GGVGPERRLAAWYRFRHSLYHTVLQTRLGTARRRELHQRIGAQKEAAYGGRADEIALELAAHFAGGGDYGRAVAYLRRAAEQATRRHANREAVVLLKQSLALLQTLPDTPERARHELGLQLALGAPLIATQGWAAAEVEQTYLRARTLCQQVENPEQLFPALYGLWVFSFTRAEVQAARELGEQLLRVAQSRQDPALLMEAHHVLGNTLLHCGELTAARVHLEHGITLYDPRQHRSHAFLYGLDDGVAGRGCTAWVLWGLGYPDQALRKTQEMLSLAHELSHPLSQAWALNSAAWHYRFRREERAAHELGEAQVALCTEQGFAQLQAVGTI